MQTLAETAAKPSPQAAAWIAAALAAAVSLLYWLGADTDTHAWSRDTVLALVGGAGLMGLAMTLAARPWDGRAARTIYFVGAAATAIVVLGTALPFLSEITSGHVADPRHAGHDVGGDDVAILPWVRTTAEVALIGVLLWLHRRTQRPAAPGITQTAA